MVFRLESREHCFQEMSSKSELEYTTSVRKETEAPTRYLIDKP